jgi:hypothetical protein
MLVTFAPESRVASFGTIVLHGAKSVSHSPFHLPYLQRPKQHGNLIGE